MSAKKLSVSRDEELRMENQLLQAKIQLLSGQTFTPMGKSHDLPLHIENQFLNQIVKMEEAKQNAKHVTVLEFLGCPSFKNVDDLSDEQIKTETIEFHKLLNNKNILCDSICEVDPRVFYKFLTEELIYEIIPDFLFPGMTCCFTYEDFHPNYEFDTCQVLERFIRNFVSENFESMEDDFDYSELTNLSKLLLFRSAFREIQNDELEIISCEVESNKATIQFKLSFKGIVGRGMEPVTYNGDCKVIFEGMVGLFMMKHVALPWI